MRGLDAVPAHPHENVEHEVLRRLERSGHDAVHVDFIPGLGKGAGDHPIGRYSLKTDRIIVTYDDDFVAIEKSAYRAVLLFEDATISPGGVASIIDNMSKVYTQTAVQGLQKAGREWL